MRTDFLRQADAWVRPVDPDASLDNLRLATPWEGALCRPELRNESKHPVRVAEVVLAAGQLPCPPETPLYGEGFQMLSQTVGTLANPVDVTGLTDRGHYRLPEVAGARTVYSLMLLGPCEGAYLLLGMGSCQRFRGEFRLWPDGRYEWAIDCEGLTLAPGESWPLEELIAVSGPDREALLDRLAERLTANHPPLHRATPGFELPPTGWCSWYWYYAAVTEGDVYANLEAITELELPLDYVQIDDGYQAAMGDWLTPADTFAGGLGAVNKTIAAQGFQPAIWVAPFVAEEGSQVFREHPDWFVKDVQGNPLRSDRVTFGGWRHGPWYVLDGTHPDAQRHLEGVFRRLREELGCTYFKLDANFWGAIHGGMFHDPHATRIEAYRRGMQAILRGAGNAFVLGCNAPMWASLGLVHGMRVTNDINRSWKVIRQVAQELFGRNWQNGRLWWNDPDCICVRDLPPKQVASAAEYRFHATMIYASGGMLLSGDKLVEMPTGPLTMLRKLLPATGHAARFDDNSFRIGRVALPEGEMLCLFNWGEEPARIDIPLSGRCRIDDIWSDEDLGVHTGHLLLQDLPPHDACLLRCQPIV